MTQPNRSSVFSRMVLPFALVPPLMIQFAMRDHAAAYRLDAASANWEWIALLVFAAELVSVTVVAGMLRLTTPADAMRPSRPRALAIAARAAAPLWASAVVLAVPSLGALVVTHLLAHAVALRRLYLDIRDEFRLGNEVQALHLTYMVYSVPVVLWAPIFVMIFVSLRLA